ncbi:glycosyltransferase WbsX family protein [Paenibacillus glufosinatiresistens]|uniref:glycosyltransferase WbsX family protein n=1 Tax=Paenibacillus glufosinatiresistens TaxID=3070657 RepID=UPI00286DF864|nr:glycoside hydrolase family 99-like domain-containing protein [Paenibacillus sp. YX.27]
MKIIAFVLPQFHAIPENDRWWGPGFTEWTNVRKAQALFPGHRQPKVPLGSIYYNLTEAATRERQAMLARRFGIYGFCYYHYWFGGGRRLLERPVQSILASGRPDFPFCLSWANEPWTRRWDGMDSDVLMPQTYGDEEDWVRHFDVLREAFLDSRYIRVEGRPMFVLYRPADIPCCTEMLECWQRLARAAGLPGLHVVRTLGGFPAGAKTEGFAASLEFEPHYTFASGEAPELWSAVPTREGELLVLDYDQLWRSILDRSPHRDGEPVYPGAFVDWDNTPRKGARGQSTLGGTPEKFGRYLARQIERAREVYESPFLFLNAWNEWAEGAFLEPDEDHGDRYLQAVRRALAESANPGENAEQGAPADQPARTPRTN